MKVRDILNITENGTVVQIYDSKTEEIVIGMTGRESFVFEPHLDRVVLALNTAEADDFGIHFELVVR